MTQHSSTAPQQVYLTFDVEPAPEGGTDHTEAILDILKQHNAQATFFLQGEWVLANEPLAKRIASEKHAIGNHTHRHLALGTAAPKQIVRDVAEAQDAILSTTGVDPRPLFRCPQSSGAQNDFVLRLLDEMGYRNVGFDIDSLDWLQTSDPRELSACIGRSIAGKTGSVVILMHNWTDPVEACLQSTLLTCSDTDKKFCIFS